jgi:hypothetical protein
VVAQLGEAVEVDAIEELGRKFAGEEDLTEEILNCGI